jgi:ABC-type molybdenum transport system ATPase subunit/photorepair protein PhrA
MVIKGFIQIDEARERELFPVSEQGFADYYRKVTGQAVPAELSATERRAFLVARALMED